MNNLKENKGITLVALVVTVVVLLILAGVSITTLIGNNGILTKTSESKQKTQEAQEKEEIGIAATTAQIGENGYQELNQTNLQNAIDNQFGRNKAIVIDNGNGTFTVRFIESKRDYNITSNGIENGINWNEAMANAKAPENQIEERNNGVIGIGTDGKPVNMDLWEYTLLDDGTYGLNDKDSLEDINKNKGYLGDFDNGKIVGKIPQYISIDSGKTFNPVTNLYATFCEVSELTTMPTIPTTTINLTNTFIRCENLKILSNIPNSVREAGSTFKGCISIEKAIEIPYGVTNIRGLFQGCTNLKEGPSIIPESVTNMMLCFLDCSNLNGKILVNADVTGYPIVSEDQNDFYRCFFGATLKENNVKLKILLKENTYQLFESQITKVYNSAVSAISLEKIS